MVPYQGLQRRNCTLLYRCSCSNSAGGDPQMARGKVRSRSGRMVVHSVNGRHCAALPRSQIGGSYSRETPIAESYERVVGMSDRWNRPARSLRHIRGLRVTRQSSITSRQRVIQDLLVLMRLNHLRISEIGASKLQANDCYEGAPRTPVTSLQDRRLRGRASANLYSEHPVRNTSGKRQ